MADDFSHLDESGAARMVDVSGKPETHRRAIARAQVRLSPATRRLIDQKALAKGDVFTVARVAAVLAAKRCGELIPLCHPLPLTDIQVDLRLTDTGVEIEAAASCVGRTGVEMEAMTAASVAALTLYDMCKSVEKGIVIENVRLIHKSGGRSGEWHAEL